MSRSARTPGDPAPFAAPRGGRQEEDLVHALDTALRLARLHKLDNNLTLEALHNLTIVLERYLEGSGRLSLVASEGWLYLNERVLGVDDDSQGLVEDFIHLLERNGLGGFVFSGRWGEDSVKAVLAAFAGAGLGNAKQRREHFEQALDLPNDAGLEVLIPQEGAATARAVASMQSRRESASRDQELQLSEEEIATYYYCRLRALAEATLEAARDHTPCVAFEQSLRLTLMKTIDALEGAAFQRRLQSLTLTEPEPGEPFAAHLANVAVHAVCMGRLLDLDKAHLLELGFAAFHHDVGRALSGRQPATKKSAELRHTAEPHVAGGVKLALRAEDLDGADLARIAVAQEHHQTQEGYPDTEQRPSLYAQLVAAADAFDRLEAGTPWAPPLSPAAALQSLGKQHDPRVVGLLRSVLGPLPRGTLLRLPDDRVVVVVDGGARLRNQPVVRPLLPVGELELLEEPEAGEVVSPLAFSWDWRLAARG